MKTERKKIRPDYYDEFSCIAGQCPITCCQEWKIAVDADTNRRWKKVPPPDTIPGCAKSQSLDQVSGDVKNCGKNLSTYTCMKDGIRVIRLDEEHRCPFLTKDKLCRLVLAYGDSILSETCTTFPREVHRFADHEEDTLMPGCPAVIDLWRHKEITFPSVVHCNADISSENAWTNVSEHTMCVKKDENKMAFLIREHILALLGDHTVSIEEALLESFFILLELYKNQSVTPELVEEYFSPETLLQLRTAITQAKSTISSLETWEECNELLQDLAVNYRKEGLYEKFLTPVITQAEYYSQIFGRQGIHVGEDMDATKGENEAGQLADRWRQFRNAFALYEPLFRNFLRNEVFSDLILPENFETEPEEADNLKHMVLQMQWIAIAYAAIRQSLFLKWSLDADGIPAEEALDYETVREYMVVISRMTGYEDEDVREYLENSFAELIWDWGYFALII